MTPFLYKINDEITSTFPPTVIIEALNDKNTIVIVVGTEYGVI